MTLNETTLDRDTDDFATALAPTTPMALEVETRLAPEYVPEIDASSISAPASMAQFVRAKPLRSLCFGAAAGFALGMLFSRG